MKKLQDKLLARQKKNTRMRKFRNEARDPRHPGTSSSQQKGGNPSHEITEIKSLKKCSNGFWQTKQQPN